MFTAVLPIKPGDRDTIGEDAFAARVTNRLKVISSDDRVSEVILCGVLSEVYDLAVGDWGQARVLDRAKLSSPSDFSGMVELVASESENEDIIWSFLTDDVLFERDLCRVIDVYVERDDKIYDSLVTCYEIQEYIFDETGPVNFEIGSQLKSRAHLPTLYAIYNGFFVTPKAVCARLRNPYGRVPRRYLLQHSVNNPEI